MPPQLRLRPQQVADLAKIRDTSLETLVAIVDHLRTVRPRPIKPRELRREIALALGAKPEDADRILRPLLSLHAVLRQHRLTADEAIEMVGHAIDSSAPSWTPDEISRWHQVEPAFKRLLMSPTVRLVSITLDLMYEYENLLQRVRVVTDIRPVFSEDATQIEGSVVSHMLRLRFDSTEGDRSISIAMDESDIRELQRQCERALLKARTAQSLMVDKAQLPTAISGDADIE